MTTEYWLLCQRPVEMNEQCIEAADAFTFSYDDRAAYCSE